MSRSLNVTPVAEPCRARQVLDGRVVVDPTDGRERLWLTNMNEAQGGELIAVDFERDTAEVHVWPAGQGSWCVLPLPGDRLAVSTYYDGKFLLFDMRSKEFTRVIGFPGESYIWTMAVGSDGRVYGGTYDGAKLGCFDPDTGQFEDCGSPVEGTGNLYLRTVMPTPNGDIACTFGYETPSLQVYRIATKRFELLADESCGLSAMVRDHVFISHPVDGLTALVGDGTSSAAELPLPECPVEGGWSGVSAFSTDQRVYMTADGGHWCWEPDRDGLEMVFDVDLRGGRIMDVSADGRIMGVRGQDYFVAQPGDTDIELRRIPGTSSGRPMHFLVGDDKGRIWGGPPFGQTVCSYEIAIGAIENTGAVVDSGGEVYGAAAIDGKLYTASYAGADLAVYDPSEPWDQWNGVNPRHIASVKDHNQCRPTGRMFAGEDGNLYSGWQAAYGRYGGALARLDPRTDEVTVWEDPLGDEPVMAMALDDRYVYLGTGHGANGLPTREGDGQFGVFDIEREEIVFSKRMEGMSGVGSLGALGNPRLALIPEGDMLHVFDADRMAFLDPLTVEVEGADWWREDVLLGDGYVLYSRGTWLVKVDADLRVELIGPLDMSVDHMAFGSDGALYFTSDTTLYRAEGL
jgi:outer membrane protein assembly factor BamB